MQFESISYRLTFILTLVTIIVCSIFETTKEINRRNTIKAVENALGKEVVFDNNLLKITSDSFELSDSVIKILTFVNSKECQSCYAQSLQFWDTFRVCIDSSKTPIIFIFDPDDEDTNSLIPILSDSNPYHVFIDTNHSFKAKNQFILDDLKMDSFLIDKNNHIVFRGNPILNDKIQTLYIKYLSERTMKGNI